MGENQMTPEVLNQRTKNFALRIIHLVESLPRSLSARVIGNQLLRSGTSVGANYRSACRSRSRSEFIAKIGVVLEEADESLYWLELLIEAKLVPESKLEALIKEANELIAIMAASRKTAMVRKNAERVKP